MKAQICFERALEIAPHRNRARSSCAQRQDAPLWRDQGRQTVGKSVRQTIIEYHSKDDEGE